MDRVVTVEDDEAVPELSPADMSWIGDLGTGRKIVAGEYRYRRGVRAVHQYLAFRERMAPTGRPESHTEVPNRV